VADLRSRARWRHAAARPQKGTRFAIAAPPVRATSGSDQTEYRVQGVADDVKSWSRCVPHDVDEGCTKLPPVADKTASGIRDSDRSI
jgi:hypothetical protein